MKYKYLFVFADGKTVTFEAMENIDFHKISNTAIAFNDIYINMSNVDFIKKEIADEALKSAGEERMDEKPMDR